MLFCIFSYFGSYFFSVKYIIRNTKNMQTVNYYRDPFDLPDYLKFSQFLADINNEKPSKNSTYKKNMLTLNAVLLVASPDNDEIVVPRTSPWFDFFEPKSDSEVQNYNDTDGYKGDWIGLQTLFDSGRLIFRSVNCKFILFLCLSLFCMYVCMYVCFFFFFHFFIFIFFLNSFQHLGTHQDIPRDDCKVFYDLYTKPLLNN
jgi:hypothetical protein